MTKDEFKWCFDALASVFPYWNPTEATVKIFGNMFRKYPFELFKAACDQYIRNSDRIPTPAGLLAYIPREIPDNDAPERYEEYEAVCTVPKKDKYGHYMFENGQLVTEQAKIKCYRRIYYCPKCQDSGLVMWRDEEDKPVGIPCECEIGHKKFRWGWLSEEEQKQWVNENFGKCGDTIGEDYNKLWRAATRGNV